VFEQIGDMWGDDMSEDQGSESRDYDQIWAMDETGFWQPNSPDDDAGEWEDTVNDEGVMEVDEPARSSQFLHIRTEKQKMRPSAPTSPSQKKFAQDVREPSTSVVIPPPPPSTSPSEFALSGDNPVNGNDHVPLKRFDILPSAPPDHAFYITTPGQHTKSFLGRLAREYRVLQSSLPESIIVRAYEDRTDLLRSLIIGPENTPYENAPFVIDWMLDSNFPNSPPLAHFWSWTAGNGRGEFYIPRPTFSH
jgi:ubiquitin-conjugating enzyme E2 O